MEDNYTNPDSTVSDKIEDNLISQKTLYPIHWSGRKLNSFPRYHQDNPNQVEQFSRKWLNVRFSSLSPRDILIRNPADTLRTITPPSKLSYPHTSHRDLLTLGFRSTLPKFSIIYMATPNRGYSPDSFYSLRKMDNDLTKEVKNKPRLVIMKVCA